MAGEANIAKPQTTLPPRRRVASLAAHSQSIRDSCMLPRLIRFAALLSMAAVLASCAHDAAITDSTVRIDATSDRPDQGADRYIRGVAPPFARFAMGLVIGASLALLFGLMLA